MIKHNLRSAFRALLRNKTFTFITSVGLATGIAIFLLLFQYVAFEWSANRFQTNYDHLYRISILHKEGNSGNFLPPGLGPILKDKFPAIADYTRIGDDLGGGVLKINTDKGKPSDPINEDNISYADQGFFKVFSFPPSEGVPSLKDPATAAISESLAHSLFGSTPATGRTINVTNQFGTLDYMITGVYKDMPAQSDIKARLLLSLSTLASPANGNTWANPNGLDASFTHIYLLLRPGSRSAAVEDQATALLHFLIPDSKTDRLALQPLSALHLAPSFDYHLQTFGSLPLVALMLIVSILILFIAWINHINLCTVQSLKRSMETGVRKVLGAARKQLIVQYLTETIILTLFSTLLALMLVSLFQPLFNQLAGLPLSLSVLNHGFFWLAGIGLIAMGTLLSGSYAAFVLSSTRPAQIFRRSNRTGTGTGKGFSWRKGLVVFQFTISIVFIIATIALYQQLRYMQSQHLGMDTRQRLILKGPTGFSQEERQHSIAFKNALSQLPFVQSFSASNAIPGQGYNYSTDGITRLNPQKGDEKKNYSMLIVDNKYFETYGITLSQGRSFTAEEVAMGRRSGKVLINETAAASLGFPPKEPVTGKKIRMPETGNEMEVIGVVKDYHHLSLHKTIDPIVFLPSVSQAYFTILTDASNMPGKISALRQLYRNYFQDNPFEYYFADEYFGRQYDDDRRLDSLFITSACLAILIACLGLFGLAAFSSRQRIKEIGIRKVLGASLTNITALISKDFIILVLLAVLIAAPIAWWGLHKWMEGFAYSQGLDWWIFPLAAILSLGVALLTVGSQAIRAALANPVESLRSE